VLGKKSLEALLYMTQIAQCLEVEMGFSTKVLVVPALEPTNTTIE